MDSAELIKQKAIELGFDLVGITDAEPVSSEQIEYFEDWLAKGRAGQMRYMHKNFEKRINPAKLLEGAKSVICVGLSYKPNEPADKISGDAACCEIANFAMYEDYHDFIKERLYKLIDFIGESITADFKFKVCVDSVPLAERAFAWRAGLGFIGRNHMLINPKFGCQILLGEIVTDLELEADGPIDDRCSHCYRCIRACPSGAIESNGCFDANKCNSYLTREYPWEIDESLAGQIGGRVFGCDECMLACPYDKNAPSASNKEFRFFMERRSITAEEILGWSQVEFEEYFANSAVQRIGLDRLKRNAKICLAKKNASGN